MNQSAFWLSSPNLWLTEMLDPLQVRHLILDIEHGTFDLGAIDTFICLAKARGFQVHAKTLAPAMSPVQQMLDLGADSVIIPHIENFDHAQEICSYAKFAPLGRRSYAGGRSVRYGAPTPAYFIEQNRKTRCYPMIETAGALCDVEAILALETVDGVFIGPSDLSLSRGRGHYGFTDADREDIQKIINAAKVAGKPWIMPAWRNGERDLARDQGAAITAVAEEQDVLLTGLAVLLERAGITPAGQGCAG
ncbi:HpcH/HpaI aldolase family protein [Nitratireductor pacificus]|uniref:Hydroxyacid aldolase n=1 Tax=Nitratireductor pacificus pht-3B TaxID=391937 RepID=K2N244_9HYPH|nr:aldolase/citrate lyase family protein [Nitratireductor pacificus]EKF18323.1 hydroxyacid aldolase [Nitratireductor pacificus pht-3B]